LLPELEAFASSLEEDFELLDYDVAGSIAHARGLRAAGLLTATQLRQIEKGLRQVRNELRSGPDFQPGDEDIHTAVERRLTEITPEGARLHAGRSRNDQVALDLRLYCRAAAAAMVEGLARVTEALAGQARRHAHWPVPGYTHLQRAQPVTIGHYLLAHAEPLLRDAERAQHAYAAADVMPLGAGAVAGSTLPPRAEVVARELGFSRLAGNSIDAVADRDFALDLLYTCTSVGLHLSRLGEDVVIWSSAEFGFIRLADEIATGSSLMPQKKNPDIAELLRGRSGRALGSLVALATILKGLPLAYDRDLQEDKTALFAGVGSTIDCLEAAALLVDHLEFDAERTRAAAADPDLLATDSAEQLVSEGVPFRDAHRRIGEQILGGDHRPPWPPEQSLQMRGIDATAGVRSVARRAKTLIAWAEKHPPPLP
jgi:argininosuccinate lyase